MAQGEFFVERQNWARWPRVLKVNRVTDSGTETRRYVRKGADWEAKDYATRKIVELQTENAKLRELVRDMDACIEALCSMVENSPGCSMCPTNQDEERPCAAADVYCRMRDLGVEVDG